MKLITVHMDRDLLSLAAPCANVVAVAVVLHSTFFFFLVLELLVLAATGRSPKMSSSDQPFGFLLFSFLPYLLFFLLPCRLRLEGEREGEVPASCGQPPNGGLR